VTTPTLSSYDSAGAGDMRRHNFRLVPSLVGHAGGLVRTEIVVRTYMTKTSVADWVSELTALAQVRRLGRRTAARRTTYPASILRHRSYELNSNVLHLAANANAPDDLRTWLPRLDSNQ